MVDSGHSRRGFLKTSTTIVAGAAVAQHSSAPALVGVEAKIRNFHPKMGYRKLGKTGFMISEISLGGHGGSSVEDRIAVLDKAVELGINYVDNNIDAECDLYGAAMARCKNAGRDRWFIGFASWPEKVTEEYEKELTPAGMMKNIEVRLRSYHTEMLDLWRPVGATWGPGQNRVNSLLMVSPKALEMVVQVFEKARQQGKVRYLGISAHNPKVFRRVLEEYPQFSVIIFPYLFLTRELGGDSLLELARRKDVGVIGLKPFGAGTTFGIRPQQITGKVDPRAPVLLREILQEPRISAVIPGVNIPEQLERNVKGSYERDHPRTAADEEILEQCRQNYLAHLTPGYQWLRAWETV
jgi:aryl-alcohol dehydrogenase-like predicted oxidoreductase